MEKQILNLLEQKDYSPSNIPELLTQLSLARNQQQELQKALKKLEISGQIIRTKGNRYIQARPADLVAGRIRMNRQGKGFLAPDDHTVQEIVIPSSATGIALHDDRVLVRRDRYPIKKSAKAMDENTGSVVRILERARTHFVGTLAQSKQFYYVIPDDSRIAHDIYVSNPTELEPKAKVGDKVVVKLLEWVSRHTNPEGEIIEVLGSPEEKGVDMLSVIKHYHLPLHFPKKVLQETSIYSPHVTEQDLIGREDCRLHDVVTIDPDDAKDFDDAICIKKISQTEYKLWVHIADVSHYVKRGGAIDIEAQSRGNSTYLVDRVIPMLPESLSNELCSLKPNVDRLTKCVEFVLSNDGHLLRSRFYSGVIRSKRRLTYKEAFLILQQPQPNPINNPIESMLHEAHILAQKIRKLRINAGSLDLDFPETKLRLDSEGNVLCVERVENDISHQLVEEYMLLANEVVATHLKKTNTQAIYRVHEEPEERRLSEYRLEVMSHFIPCGNLTKRVEIQKLFKVLEGTLIGPALKINFLRSLMRARYAIEPMGHYGLSKKNYTHFTSPIRRYADLVVHRALFAMDQNSHLSLREIAQHISDTERNSQDAERDSKDIKLFAFLKRQLDSEDRPIYQAMVTELRNFGFFVELPDLAMSGLVPFSALDDDFYILDSRHNQLVGRRNRRAIRIGDMIKVQVAKVDIFKKQVDFRLAPSKSTFKKGFYQKKHKNFRKNGKNY